MKKTCFNLYSTLCIAVVLVSIVASCSKKPVQSEIATVIEESMLANDGNFYAVDFSVYKHNTSHLPIGVFDSGTGGLTVLNALLEFDKYSNSTHTHGGDGIPDFLNEKFIYLADQANMPYGNYYSANNSGLLIEHILKDTQFLLSDKYYPDHASSVSLTDKEPVKIIVIACNTATAYGKEYIEAFIKRTGVDLKIIGVIDAGARGALEVFRKDENGSIGVLATVGTIASNGYENTLRRFIDEYGYSGNVMIFNHGGYGIAEAVDEEKDFIDRSTTSPRESYRGPSWNDPNYSIDKALWDVYNFDKDKILCDSKNVDDCQIIQLNSSENYIRYHLVSMMEKMRNTPGVPPLKALLLGCTHYPYLTGEIRTCLTELYNYKQGDKFLYRDIMAPEIELIDPALNVAQELHEYMESRNIFNGKSSVNESEFYISVPNIHNPDVVVDENGSFTYDYKFGRKEGSIQEYVKVVPFSKQNISEETLDRLEKLIPSTYSLMVHFNHQNSKTAFLRDSLVSAGKSFVIR